jgi:hypothetical protein
VIIVYVSGVMHLLPWDKHECTIGGSVRREHVNEYKCNIEKSGRIYQGNTVMGAPKKVRCDYINLGTRPTHF